MSDFGAIKHKLADIAVKTFAIESTTYRIGHLIELKYQSFLSSGMSPSESKLSAIREYAIDVLYQKFMVPIFYYVLMSLFKFMVV